MKKISYFKLISSMQTKIFLLILQILLYYTNITNYNSMQLNAIFNTNSLYCVVEHKHKGFTTVCKSFIAN